MRKPELAAFIADKADIPVDAARQALDAMLAEITAALARGESVSLLGFGTFEPRQRAARQGKNPQTGAPIAIAARTNIGFKPGKALREALN